MASQVAVHTISIRGKAGAIFILLCCAIVLYLIGFITHGWAFKRNSPSDGNQTREGLWEECTCHRLNIVKAWDHAVVAMICIGLVGLLIAFLLISIYMCVHTVSKNSTIIALVCVCFIAVVFMLIGFIIYAVGKIQDDYTLNWSFAITVLSSILTLIAGVVSIIQMRSSGVKL